MKEGDISPNEFSYTAAANACAKTGDWEQALELLTEMRERDGLSPNEFTYSAAVGYFNIELKGKGVCDRNNMQKWRGGQ